MAPNGAFVKPKKSYERKFIEVLPNRTSIYLYDLQYLTWNHWEN
jgi:hypothetical protein